MIKPSSREKKRYILYHFLELKENLTDFEIIKKTIQHACFNFLGEINYAKAGIIVLPEFHNNRGILKVSKDYVNEVKFALGLIKEINGKKTSIIIPKTSGNINKLMFKIKGVI